jgi:tripartite-type tricarboxylate transporter receptor subunit TctC
MLSARLIVGSMSGFLRRATVKCGLRCARAPWLLLVTALLATIAGHPALSDDQSVTFKGMTINIDVGFGPGGGYDLYARVLARHLGKYLPGNPTVIVRNMPGGGSLRVANYIYSVAPKDGSELGAIAASAAMDSLMGNDQAAFEIAKLGWVGSMDQDVSFCGVWDRPENPKTFQEMLTRETTFGATGAGATSYTHPLILRNLLGAKVKIISGFSGTKETNLAMQRGEVAASCSLFGSTITTTLMDDVNSGRLKLFIQMGPQRSDQFGKVPSVYDFAKTEEDRKVLAVHFDQILLARPIIAPAGTAPERLRVLRAGFDASMKDPELIQNAEKQGLVINPVNGGDVEKLLVQFANYPSNIIARARAVIDR